MSTPPHPPSASISSALGALRSALDQIDDQLLALLAQRAAVVGEIRQFGGKGPVKLRPGREAAILRRLLAQKHGELPRQTVVRIWRELFASSLAMQGSFSLSVGGETLAAAAREQFGALTPVSVSDPASILTAMAAGDIGIGIVPSFDKATQWWQSAPFLHQKIYIVGRLPFWADRPAGCDTTDALVISSQPPDQSGDDRSLILLQSADQRAAIDTQFGHVRYITIGQDVVADVAGFVEPGMTACGMVIGCYATPLLPVPAPDAGLSPNDPQTP